MGPAWRHLGGLDINVGAFSSGADLPRLPSGSAGGSLIPPLTGYANRTYLDGFVFIDDSTENPNSFLPGTTGYWGYSSDSQVRDGALQYQSGGYSKTSASQSIRRFPEENLDEFEVPALHLQFDLLRPAAPNLKLGASVGFLVSSGDSELSATTFRASQRLDRSVVSVADIYDLQGVIPPLAPYSGSFSHPGTAPLIDNIPSRRIISQQSTTSQETHFFNEVDVQVDLDIYTLSIGPMLEWDCGPLSLNASAGLALNLASWRISHREQLFQATASGRRSINQWDSSSTGTDLLPGFYSQVSASFAISRPWAVSFFGRYDWNASLEERVGPSSLSVDLSGFTLGGALTFSF